MLFRSAPPTVRDEKRAQSELLILAQKKTIEFEIDYYQCAARNIARQLIENATVLCLPEDQIPIISTEAVLDFSYPDRAIYTILI